MISASLRDWLPSVLQSVKPFFTPSDIEKGARWSKDIAQELDSSAVGIFCLTKENLTKPWIMFEAGALSKNLDVARVCPILFGVDNAELQGPLVQFQASPFSEVEMRKLVRTLNNSIGDQRLDDTVLSRVFTMWWPTLHDKVKGIMEKHSKNPSKQGVERSDRELLEEVLQLTRLSTKTVKREKSELDLSPLNFAVSKLSELDHYVSVNSPGKSLIKDIARALDYFGERVDMPPTTRTELEGIINSTNANDLL